MYPCCMGLMGLSVTKWVCCLILVSGATSFILGFGVENMHVG